MVQDTADHATKFKLTCDRVAKRQVIETGVYRDDCDVAIKYRYKKLEQLNRLNVSLSNESESNNLCRIK